MKSILVALVLLVSVPLFAADYERVMLPIKPSLVMCGYHSQYETQLVMFNGNDRVVEGLAPNTGAVLSGTVDAVPMPQFFYVPKDAAEKVKMSLLVESQDRAHPEARSYSELPVVRESDFRQDRIQLVGVRIDEGFRQTLRIYGLDGTKPSLVRVKIYPLDSNRPIGNYPMIYELRPYGDDSPTFNMECDLSNFFEPGLRVRVVVESLTPDTKIWGFISVANNKTQHFYTVLPQ